MGINQESNNDANLLYDQFHTLTKGYTHYSSLEPIRIKVELDLTP